MQGDGATAVAPAAPAAATAAAGEDGGGRLLRFSLHGEPHRVLREGFMEKRVAQNGGLSALFPLRRRYFLLTPQRLMWFKSELPPAVTLCPPAEGDVPLSVLDGVGLATHADDLSDVIQELKDPDRHLVLHVPHRDFMLRAPSAADAVAWRDAIEAAATGAKGGDAVYASGEAVVIDRAAQTPSPSHRRTGSMLKLFDSVLPQGKRSPVRDDREGDWWRTGGLAPRRNLGATGCTVCTATFSALRRRVHCSICGLPFCADCSRHSIMRKRCCDSCYLDAFHGSAKDGPKRSTALLAAALPERLRPYARLHHIGVPLLAVFYKMRSEGVDAELAKTFARSRHDAGDAYDIVYGASAATRGHRRAATTSRLVKTQPLYWDTVKKRSAEAESVWQRSKQDVTAGRRSVTVLPSEQVELEQLFKLRQPARQLPAAASPVAAPAPSAMPAAAGHGGTGAGGGNGTNSGTSLVDVRRSQNVEIALRRFVSRAKRRTLKTLLYSITKLKPDVYPAAPPHARPSDLGAYRVAQANLRLFSLSAAQLTLLRSALPLAEELPRLRSFRGDRRDLREGEQWLVLAAGEQRLEEKLLAAYWYDVAAERIGTIVQTVTKIVNASEQIMGSERLARLLEVTLAVGNQLNREHSRLGSATGFTVDTLMKLCITKAVDNETTLLRFIVRILRERGEGDLLCLDEDMPDLAAASRLDEYHAAAECEAIVQGVAATREELRLFDEEERLKREREQAARERRLMAKEEAPSQALKDLRDREEDADATKKLMKAARSALLDLESDLTFGESGASDSEDEGAEEETKEGRGSGSAAAAAAEAGAAARTKADPPAARPSSAFCNEAARRIWRSRMGSFAAFGEAEGASLNRLVELMHASCESLCDYFCEPSGPGQQAKIFRVLNSFRHHIREADALEAKRELRLREHSEREELGRLGVSHVAVGQRIATAYGPGTVEAKPPGGGASAVVWLGWGRAYLRPEAVCRVDAAVEVRMTATSKTPLTGVVTHIRAAEDAMLEVRLDGAGAAVAYVAPEAVRFRGRLRPGASRNAEEGEEGESSREISGDVSGDLSDGVSGAAAGEAVDAGEADAPAVAEDAPGAAEISLNASQAASEPLRTPVQLLAPQITPIAVASTPPAERVGGRRRLQRRRSDAKQLRELVAKQLDAHSAQKAMQRSKSMLPAKTPESGLRRSAMSSFSIGSAKRQMSTPLGSAEGRALVTPEAGRAALARENGEDSESDGESGSESDGDGLGISDAFPWQDYGRLSISGFREPASATISPPSYMEFATEDEISRG